MKIYPIRLLPVCLAALVLTLGCGSPAPEGDGGHDHADAHADGHEHPDPTNFTEALANVEAINSEISEAFVSGDTKEADDALHEVFHAVEDLGGFAKKDGLDEAKTKEVAEASKALLGAYDYLHGVHGGKEVDYGQVQSDIEGAIARLAAVDPNHPEDHDHGSEKKGSDNKEESNEKPAAE